MDWRSVSYDWNQVRAFLATVEEGSLSAAARALGLTQPTLGRQVAGLEAALGVTLFERIGKTPNSVDSHRLVRFAHERGLGDEVVEALFVEFFINGRDIGDLRVLTEIGAANGLDAQEVEAYLNTDADVGVIHDENVRAHRLGINGVPSFAFNEKFVISGAQEPQVLARMLDAALAKEDAA